MKIGILGFDIEGRSSYAYYAGQEDEKHDITILDQKADVTVPDGVNAVRGDDYLNDLDRFDLIVRTAGLPPHKIFEANPGLARSKVTTQINEFFQLSPTKNIIGVTGTKGKGTTSTMITRMLQEAGKDAQLAGNIGVPALDLLPELTEDSWVVLELSSFQLIDLRYSPAVAVCLMVAPEHLDWHADMAEYVTAKQQLFVWQTYDDIAIYLNGNEYSSTIASAGNGAKVPYYAAPGAVVANGTIAIGGQVICHTSELKLIGEHNWQNVCAAVTAAWQITHSVAALRSVLGSFSGLEHRLQFVRELDGVTYYDDSFGTTPEAAIVAIKAFTEPKVVILGGSDKGADFEELADAVVSNNVQHVVLIGNTGNTKHASATPAIQQALEAKGFMNITSLVKDGHTTMEDIVQAARTTANHGDVVILSPGCASFDMFQDYKDRADQFTTAVNALS